MIPGKGIEPDMMNKIFWSLFQSTDKTQGNRSWTLYNKATCKSDGRRYYGGIKRGNW